jgi:hypothetical protein
MAVDKNVSDYEPTEINWEVPEYDIHRRGRNWYFIAITVALLLLIYSFWTGNFLFAVIIIVAALIMILHEGKEPDQVRIILTDEGVIVGRRFYDYDEIKNFSLVYKPRLKIKNLYFEFKVFYQPRLSIPLENMNPLPIREFLLKYLSEDLERTDQPLSEFLGKLFKL